MEFFQRYELKKELFRLKLTRDLATMNNVWKIMFVCPLIRNLNLFFKLYNKNKMLKLYMITLWVL